jgi:hypothetical protein
VCASLERTIRRAGEQLRAWSTLFGTLMSLSSSAHVCGEFVPTWRIASHSTVFECGDGDVGCYYETHVHPSLVFEGVALCYLCAALCQQRATLLLEQGDEGRLAAAQALLDGALAHVSTAEQRWLPLFLPPIGARFRFRTPAPPHLLAVRFYGDFVRPIIEASRLRIACQTADSLAEAARQLERSALSLLGASRTGFGDSARLVGAATQRHAVALTLLAQAFVERSDEADSCSAEAALDALDALVCSRAACAAMPDDAVAREQFTSAVHTAKTRHSMLFVDAELALETPEQRDNARRAVSLTVVETGKPVLVAEHHRDTTGSISTVPDLRLLRCYTIGH